MPWILLSSIPPSGILHGSPIALRIGADVVRGTVKDSATLCGWMASAERPRAILQEALRGEPPDPGGVYRCICVE
jgi:hypothetical protein